jgi:hypothetical protein
VISLKKIINPKVPVAALLIVTCVLLWFVPLSSKILLPEVTLLPGALGLCHIFPPQSLLTLVASMAVILLNGFLLTLLNTKFTLIRERTFLIFLVYFILLSIWHTLHYFLVGNIAATVIIVSFFIFLNMYHRRDATEEAFLGSFFIAITGLLVVPEFLLLFVPVWLGFLAMKAFSLKVFLASLVGLITPIILLFSVGLIDFQSFIMHFKSIGISWGDISENYSSLYLIHFSILLILIILTTISNHSNKLKDVVRTRKNLSFVEIFLFFTLAITVGYLHVFIIFLPLIAALFSIVFAKPITLSHSKYTVALFFVFCAVNLVYLAARVLS